MEEVTEDIDAESGEVQHPNELHAQPPHFVKALFYTLLDILTQYGWPILFLVVSLIIIWTSFLEPKIREWWRRKCQMEYDAALHRDPDLAISRQEAMIAARLRMQQQHDQQAEIHREKEKLRDEEKARKKAEEWSKQRAGLPGVTEPPTANSTGTSRPRPTQRLRNNDFNPMMGGGGSSGYRPSRRGGGG